MKKNVNGFLLAETLIVSTFISVILIYLFIQFRNINNNYTKTLKYNGVNEIHLLNQVKLYLEDSGLEKISSKISFENTEYLLLNECSPELFENVNYCTALFNSSNIVNAVYMDSNNIVESENFSVSFNDFLKTIKAQPSMHVIIAEFTDGSFASLLINSSKPTSLEELVKKQPIYYDVSSGAGLYYDNTNTSYVFKSDDANKINNNIKILDYNGKIISIDEQGIKVYLELKENVEYDDGQGYFTSSNILSSGSYTNNNIGNSSLFSILNSISDELEKENILKPNVSYSVGKIDSIIGNTFENIVNAENEVKFKSTDSTKYVASLTVSDIIRASIDTQCDYNNISNNCLTNNWLSENVWTMNHATETSVWGISNNTFNSFQVGPGTLKNAYAVVYINPELSVIGDGTENNPYRF